MSGHAFAAWSLAVSLLAAPGSADACDTCQLPMGPHRMGSFAVRLATVRSSYRVGGDMFVRVTLVNHGTKPMYVDPGEPVWRQTSIHVRDASGGVALSQGDVPAGNVRTMPIAPGASFTFASPGGLALARWGFWSGYRHRPGRYDVDVSYGGVDSNTIEIDLN